MKVRRAREFALARSQGGEHENSRVDPGHCSLSVQVQVQGGDILSAVCYLQFVTCFAHQHGWIAGFCGGIHSPLIVTVFSLGRG